MRLVPSKDKNQNHNSIHNADIVCPSCVNVHCPILLNHWRHRHDCHQLKPEGGGTFRPHSAFLGTLAKFRKATISFAISVRSPAWRQLVSHWMDFYEIWRLINYLKICRENSSSIQIWREYRTLYMNTNVHLRSHIAELFLGWEIFFRPKTVEKIKTRI